MKNAFSQKIMVISVRSSWCNFRTHQTDFQLGDVQTLVSAITHSFVTLKTLVKSKGIFDIIFKGIIHKRDTGQTKMGENCL